MKTAIRAFSFCVAAALAAPAQADMLWLNVVNSDEYGHYLASIGAGHYLPGEDTLTPSWGIFNIERYELTTPGGNVVDLGAPVNEPPETEAHAGGVRIQTGGDGGVRKIMFGRGAKEGVYTLTAQSPMEYFVRYYDADGKEQYSSEPPEEAAKLGKIKKASIYRYYVKTQFAAGEGSAKKEVAPAGQFLEIVPLTDLSTVEAGDVAEFRVLLDGKPLSLYGAHITAVNDAFGRRWGLYSKLVNGVGAFRLPVGGQWRIEAIVNDAPENIEGMTAWEGRVDMAEFVSTFTFHAQP